MAIFNSYVSLPGRVDLSELSAAQVLRRCAGYLGDPPATGEVPQRDGRDGGTEALRSIKVEFDEELTRW